MNERFNQEVAQKTEPLEKELKDTKDSLEKVNSILNKIDYEHPQQTNDPSGNKTYYWAK